MASADITVKVAVEAAIHQALRLLIEQLQAEHGLRITALSAVWHDTSTVSKRAFEVDTLRIQMES